MPTTTSSRRGSRARRAPAVEIGTYSQAVRCLHDRVNFERMRVIRLDSGSFKQRTACEYVPISTAGARLYGRFPSWAWADRSYSWATFIASQWPTIRK